MSNKNYDSNLERKITFSYFLLKKMAAMQNIDSLVNYFFSPFFYRFLTPGSPDP